MKKRVIGYARVSTEKQDLERQNILIRNYCKENNCDLIKIIAEKVSGAKEDRESIKELLDVDSNIADIVVVSELSRLSREEDILPVLNTINNLLKAGLDIIFLDNTSKIYKAYQTLGLFEIITLTVNANAASEERKKIRHRMDTGKRTKLQNNPYMYTGGTAPYGFKVVANPEFKGQTNNKPATSLIEIDREKIENVKLVFELVINGVTLRDIAKQANNLGWKTQLNKPFCETSVSKMIKNPIYNGVRIVKEMKLEIEKIIPDEMFNLAQVCISDNQLFKTKATKNFNPLKGIVFCPCGYGLMLHKMCNRKDIEYFVLQCCKKNDNEYRKICLNKSIESSILFTAVWNVVRSSLQLSEYSIKSDAQIALLNSLISQLNEQLVVVDAQKETAKTEMENIANAMLQVTVQSLISRYEAKYVEKEKELKKLDEERASILSQISKKNEEIQKLTSISKETAFANTTEEEKAVIYKRVLNRVVYYSVDNLKGFIVISFKNGMEVVVVVRKSYNGFLSYLPTSFKFNIENRSVEVNQTESTPDSIYPNVRNVSYTYSELVEAFDLSTWYEIQ